MQLNLGCIYAQDASKLRTQILSKDTRVSSGTFRHVRLTIFVYFSKLKSEIWTKYSKTNNFQSMEIWKKTSTLSRNHRNIICALSLFLHSIKKIKSFVDEIFFAKLLLWLRLSVATENIIIILLCWVAAQAVRWSGIPKVARSRLTECSKSCDLQPKLHCAIRGA